jgi:hypothetical protein
VGAVLFPREHGAYAQLAFPILSGLLLGRPGWAAFGFAAAAILIFMTSEPVEILVGVRGAHPRERSGSQAKRQIAAIAPIAAATGLAALAMAPPQARLIASAPMAVGAALIPMVLFRRLKTLTGEILAALGFAALHPLIGASSGLSGPALTDPAAVWFLAFATATIAVHAIKARHQHREPRLPPAALAASILVTLGAAVVALHHPAHRAAACAVAIPSLTVLGVNLLRVSPRSLKAVGWCATAANAAALAVLVFGRP